ncbi:MAG: four helix bundle protein [Candidatus Sungbacteria bacterium]|nr:four helix bundle protein [Candidatus Sungbacteria bacterium]
MKSHKDLVVWQRAIILVQEVYSITETFPKSEVYGLSSQMQRAAVSIPSNIAEGYKRRSRKEYVHFLNIGNASAAELETQLIITGKLYPPQQQKTGQALGLLSEIQRMLTVLIRRLSSPQP